MVFKSLLNWQMIVRCLKWLGSADFECFSTIERGAEMKRLALKCFHARKQTDRLHLDIHVCSGSSASLTRASAAQKAHLTWEKPTDHTVHVGFSPDDVVIVVDDHWSTEDMEVLHDVFLHVGQRGDVCVVTWRTHKYTLKHTVYGKLLRLKACFYQLNTIFILRFKAFEHYIKSNKLIYQTSENLGFPKTPKSSLILPIDLKVLLMITKAWLSLRFMAFLQVKAMTSMEYLQWCCEATAIYRGTAKGWKFDSVQHFLFCLSQKWVCECNWEDEHTELTLWIEVACRMLTISMFDCLWRICCWLEQPPIVCNCRECTCYPLHTDTHTHCYDCIWPGLCLQYNCAHNLVFNQRFLMSSEQGKGIMFSYWPLHNAMWFTRGRHLISSYMEHQVASDWPRLYFRHPLSYIILLEWS